MVRLNHSLNLILLIFFNPSLHVTTTESKETFNIFWWLTYFCTFLHYDQLHNIIYWNAGTSIKKSWTYWMDLTFLNTLWWYLWCRVAKTAWNRHNWENNSENTPEFPCCVKIFLFLLVDLVSLGCAPEFSTNFIQTSLCPTYGGGCEGTRLGDAKLLWDTVKVRL